jgi:hypothetical protein
LAIFFGYILGLCSTNWLLQAEKKLTLWWEDPLKEKSIFPKKNDAILNQSAILIFRKKFLPPKLDTKNTLRMQKRILKSGKNCAFESKNTNTKVFDAILVFAAILSDFIIFG